MPCLYLPGIGHTNRCQQQSTGVRRWTFGQNQRGDPRGDERTKSVCRRACGIFSGYFQTGYRKRSQWTRAIKIINCYVLECSYKAINPGQYKQDPNYNVRFSQFVMRKPFRGISNFAIYNAKPVWVHTFRYSAVFPAQIKNSTGLNAFVSVFFT